MPPQPVLPERDGVGGKLGGWGLISVAMLAGILVTAVAMVFFNRPQTRDLTNPVPKVFTFAPAKNIGSVSGDTGVVQR